MATDHNFKVKNGLVVEGGEIFVQGTSTPQIYFNGSSDTSIDMAIKATPESLDFYEPEDNNKLHMRIVDDAGVNAVFGFRTGVNDGTLRIDGSGNLTNIGTISSGAITATGSSYFGSTSSNNDQYIRGNSNVGLRIQTNAQGTGGADGMRVGLNGVHAFVWQFEALPLAFATSGTERLSISAGGSFDFKGGNFSNAGTITSGAISSGSSITASGDVNLRNNTTGDNTTIRDVNFMTTAAEGTDDRVALVRGRTQGGTGTTRGGSIILYTRKANQSGFNATVMDNVGNFTLESNAYLAFGDTNTKVEEGGGNSVRVVTNSGYMEIGPQNTDWSHIQTDRASFYFNKKITVDTGIVESYNEDLVLRRAQSSADQITLGTTGVTFASGYTLNMTGAITTTGTISSGAITSSGNIVNDVGNTGDDSFIELKNTGYTGNVTSLRQNADSTRAELNSSQRSIFVQAGLSSSNSAEFRVYTNAVQALKLDASQNATFASNITTTTTIQGGAYKLGSTVIVNSNRDLTNIGTISSGAITSTGSVTGTYFLASGGDSTPAGTTFSNVFKGSNSRTVYFDSGDGSTISTWYGSGNTPYAAIDATNGVLKLYVNDTSGNWHQKIGMTSSGVTHYGTVTSTGVSNKIDSGSYATFEADGNTNEWKWLRLSTNGTTAWDIAARNNDLSNALQFRPAGGSTNRTYMQTNGNWIFGKDIQAQNATFTGTGDVTVKIVADTDNVTETDTPTLGFSQDGNTSGTLFVIGLEGNPNTVFPGSIVNAPYIHGNVSSTPLQIANRGKLVATFDSTSTNPALTITKFSNITGTNGSTILNLKNYMGSSATTGDLSQQKSFIDFQLLDSNANEVPQVRIGAEVGEGASADSQELEGSGAFVVYTNDAESTSGDAGASLTEKFRVAHDGRLTYKGDILYTGGFNYHRSDHPFAFLSSGGSAQNVRTKSVFAGTTYGDTPPAGSVNATNTYELNGQTVIDSSRNLTNIGSITASGVATVSTLKETDGGDGFTEIGSSNFGYFSWGIEIANPNNGYRAIRFAGKKKYFVLEADVLGTSNANHQGFFWGNADGTAIHAGSTTGYKTTHQNSTSFHIRAINTNSNQETYNPGFSPADGNWHHQKIMVTPDGYVRIWIDGDLKFEETGYIPSAEGYLGFVNYAGTVRYANIRCRTINEEDAVSFAPSAVSITSSSIVSETVEIVFGQSSTSGVSRYEIWSDGGGSDFSLIGKINAQDAASSMSFVDTTFADTGTINYRVYAVRYGIYSTAATTSVSFSQPSLDVTNFSAIADLNNFYLQYEKPDSRFLDHIEIYVDTDAASSNLARSSASLIYSGDNSSYMYTISASDRNNFHQFWVECVGV